MPSANVELGGSASKGSERMQTVTLVLRSPVDKHDEPVNVASAFDIARM